MADLAKTTGYRWWAADDASIHHQLIAAITHCQTRQRSRLIEDWRHARLYQGVRDEYRGAFSGLGGSSGTGTTTAPSRLPRYTINVIEMCIETVKSRMVANTIRPTCVTDGGDWEMQERGEAMTTFLDGALYGSKFRGALGRWITDTLVFGTGVLKVYEERGSIGCGRVIKPNVLVDDIDGIDQKPRQAYEWAVMARDRAVALFGDTPEKIAAIRKAPLAQRGTRDAVVADVIMLYEGWHLPSPSDYDGADSPGKHVIACEGIALVSEPWDVEAFPLIFLRWRDALVGMFGTGICHQLTHIQIEINRSMSAIQQKMSAGAFKIFVEASSQVITAQLNRELGGIVKYHGNPPQFVCPETVSPNEMAYIQMLVDRALQQVGVSPMATSGVKPDGLDSKVALREFREQVDARFADFENRLEDAVKEVAGAYLRLAKSIHERMAKEGKEGGPRGFSTVAVSSAGLKRINWDQVHMEEDEYVVEIFAESGLPKEPSARLQSIQEMLQANLMTPDEGRRSLGNADMKADMDLENAQRSLCLKQFSSLLHGKPVTPDPVQDLAMLQKVLSQGYALASVKDVPETRLQMMRETLSLVSTMVAMNTPPPAPGPGGPMATPAPLPTSPMLPQGGAPPQIAA